ncbi:uncharacterized protein LOC144180229 [Haemaphysalis longicornis]
MLPGISPPPPFLVSPGTLAIPWPRWLRLFENFTLASGASELSAARRRALLLHCLGPEGQRIFDALPPPPPPNAPDHPPAHPSAGTAPLQTVTPSATTAAVGTTEIKQADAELAQPPDEYDAAVQALARHFSATCNVRVERHRFRDRRQLHGEPISEFALALRELASSCNFAAQADTNLCDQFVAGVTCPRLRERLLLEGDALTFDRAVEIALLREQVQRESEALGTAPVDRVVPQHNRGRNPAGRRRHVRQSSSTDRRSTPSSSRSGFVRPPAPEIASAIVPYSVNTNVCGNCGAQNCQPSACAARGRACFACGRRGHFQQYCRNSRRGRGRRPARVAEIVSEDAESVVNILTVHAEKRTGVYVDVGVQPVALASRPCIITFLVDTGSAVSIMGEHNFRSRLRDQVELKKSQITLLDFSRRKIPVHGQFTALVTYKSETAVLTFHVTPGGTSLLGIDAVKALGLQIVGTELRCLNMAAEPNVDTKGPKMLRPEMHSQDTNKLSPPTTKPPLGPPKFGMPTSLWAKFGHLFSPELGLAKGVQHRVKLKQSVAPVTQKLRRLPLSVREAVSDELRNLLSADVIECVNASEWVSPIVAARKKDGSIRICVDLREANKAVVVDSFPLPHTEELLHALNGARYFSKLDLASAYYQVLLHPDSRDITAFITHDGLFRFKRVCFGLASAPAAFQQLMTSILQGCKGVLCYLDDVIIFGKSEKEHMRNLEEVLQRISHAGLKLNDKCVFNTSELSFLGHRVSAEGVAPLQTKVDAIVHAATPTDAGKLRSFLGLVEYYARFVPRLAEEVEPMRRLLRKDTPFNWDTAAENSLTRVKSLLASHRVLQMFDPALPVIVATDASAYGLGAVLQQVDGRHIRTVAFASRTLTEAERKYSTGEREALACLWALEKWHVYLWGRPVTLQTDHQALVALLSAQGTGQRPLRIARWTARLLRYNFTVQYRRGEHNKVADALSRLPLPDTEGGPESEEEIVSLVMCVHHDELKHATAENSTLQDVARYVQTSWPPRKNLALNLTPYYEVRKELTVVDGILLRTERIVVPAKLTATFVQLAHEYHPGLRGEDVDDWLDEYARVSAFNRWDDAVKLQQVSISLDEVAKTWFLNNAHPIDDLASFCQELRKIFGTTAARMPEADKVRHILKGIASFAFNALVVQNPTSVSYVRTTCQRLDELQAVRLQPAALATPSQGDTDLRFLIRQIIRGELQLSDPLSAPRYHFRTEAPRLRDLVKEELASIAGVTPSTSPGPTTPTPSYSAIASKPPLPMQAPLAHGHLTAIPAASMPRGYYTNMHPGRQPFPGDRPCAIIPHIWFAPASPIAAANNLVRPASARASITATLTLTISPLSVTSSTRDPL